jgi:hypothetical protein
MLTRLTKPNMIYRNSGGGRLDHSEITLLSRDRLYKIAHETRVRWTVNAA